ncbi:MAG: twin-arginine translocase subunit TatC [Armatimonadetes bacterium]|nr:twin-arginine translocase subunit TatC [Armatimonadota bacterium]
MTIKASGKDDGLAQERPEGEESFDREMDLIDHLAELRSRIIRSLLYLLLTTFGCWFFFQPLYSLLMRPIHIAFGPKVGEIVYLNFTEPFFVQFQICLVAGVIVAMPLLLGEVWGFIVPALTRQERRWALMVLPFAAFLFFMGVALAYFIFPGAIGWFLSFLPSDARVLQSPLRYVTFLIKMCLAFGLVFQLPLILMFLASVGVISSELMKQQWRGAIVSLAIVAAVLTPSNDAFTMLMMAVPLVILFATSIGLVQLVERHLKKSEE